MTLYGILRQVEAAQRRAQRNEERQQRLHARALKLQAKANELEHAVAEVEAFEERLQLLRSIHQSAGESMDWIEICERPAPSEPQKIRRWEELAVHAQNEFQANFWQRLFGKEQELRAELAKRVVEAKQRDEISHRGAIKLHMQQAEQWQQLNQLANAIVHGDTTAYIRAFEELVPLSEMQDIGCEAAVSFPDTLTAEIALIVESESVVPRESKSLTRSGKLSIKPVPQGKFQELYQDYVCGCALRAARELFSFLPLTRIIVNVNATMLDPATGHQHKQTILSVGMPRKTIEGMNFLAVDPSNSMTVFAHRMGFKRSQGFFPILPLAASEYPQP